MAEVGVTTTDVRAVVERLLRDHGRPTALVAQYAIAVQILDACAGLGVRVPDDVSLVALTDSETAHLLRTPMSAIRTDYELLGSAAAAAMREALVGQAVVDQVVPSSVHWIERDSTGPAPESFL